jgi:hypothetical protein
VKIREAVLGVLLCIGLVLTVWLSCALSSKESAESFLRRMPIDSKISDLPAAIPKGWDDPDVISWSPLKTPAEREYSSPHREKRRKVAFGSTWYRVKDADWHSIDEIADQPRFTGEIVIYSHGLLKSEAVGLVYIDGILRYKDWGYLPG